MPRKGILFVISGPSGVGKGTIREKLIPHIDVQESISATTRQARVGEEDGKDYFFISREKFLEMVAQEEFLEWASVYANLYGTPKEFVINSLEKGKDVLLEIDIQGALQIKKRMPEGVFIFISPPSIEELAMRLCGRGKDTPDSINRRLAACEEEIKQKIYYDYEVVNDDIDVAVNKIKSIITAERCKIKNFDLG